MTPAILTKRRLPFGTAGPPPKRACARAAHPPSSPTTPARCGGAAAGASPAAAALPAAAPLARGARPDSAEGSAGSGGAPAPTCYFCRRMPAAAECERCAHVVCELCARACEGCYATACRCCSVIDYDRPREVELCLDCHTEAAGAARCGGGRGAVAALLF